MSNLSVAGIRGVFDKVLGRLVGVIPEGVGRAGMTAVVTSTPTGDGGSTFSDATSSVQFPAGTTDLRNGAGGTTKQFNLPFLFIGDSISAPAPALPPILNDGRMWSFCTYAGNGGCGCQLC